MTDTTDSAGPTRTFRPTLIAAGVLLVAANLAQFATDSSGAEQVRFAQTPLHLVVSLAALASFVLVAFALVALHQRQRGGRGEAVSYVLAVVFTMFAVGASWAQTFFDPFIAKVAPAEYGGTGDMPPTVGVGFAVTYLGLGLFVAIYGIVTALAGRLSPPGAILLAVGALATAFPFDAAAPLGAVIIAAGLIWLALVPARHTAALGEPSTLPAHTAPA